MCSQQSKTSEDKKGTKYLSKYQENLKLRIVEIKLQVEGANIVMQLPGF